MVVMVGVEEAEQLWKAQREVLCQSAAVVVGDVRTLPRRCHDDVLSDYDYNYLQLHSSLSAESCGAVGSGNSEPAAHAQCSSAVHWGIDSTRRRRVRAESDGVGG